MSTESDEPGSDDPIEAFVNSSSSTRDASADRPDSSPWRSPGCELRRSGMARHGPGDSGLPQARWLSRLLETGPQPFAVVDVQQRFIRANHAFADLVGYSADELLGMSVLDLTAEESRDLTRRYHADVLATGRNERLVKNYRHKNGSLVPVELMVDVFRDDAGKPVGLYAFITDISDRIRAEEAVRDSEQRYHQLYDEAPVGYHEIDCDGRIVSINRTACELLGYDFSELIGRSVLDLIAPEERELAAWTLHQKFAGDRPLVPYQQVLVTRRRGSSDRGDPGARAPRTRRPDRGPAQRGSGYLRTGRKPRPRWLNRRRAPGPSSTGSTMRSSCTIRKGGSSTPIQRRASQLGYSRDELMGLNTSQIDAPEFAAGFQERLRRQLQEGRLTCEGLHRTKSGKLIPVEVTTSTIHFDNQVAVLAIFRDITERKALERTRREFASAQMRNAQEMELKNRALSESESRYRRLAEGSLDAIVVADGEGRVTLFNPAAEKIFGYEPQEILGRPLEQLIPEVAADADRHAIHPRPVCCSSPRLWAKPSKWPVEGATAPSFRWSFRSPPSRWTGRLSTSARFAIRPSGSGCGRCSLTPTSSPRSAS